MDDIITKLTKLSQKRHKSDDDMEKFQKYIQELSVDQICELIKDRIACSDGPQIVNCILLGLTLKSQCQKKRFKVFEVLMSEMQSEEISSRNVSTILSWLGVELEKLSVPHLVRVCDLCVNYVGTSSDPNKTCWKDLLPKGLNLISPKKDIEHYGSEKSGEEYKKQVIVSLCQAKWHKSILTPLASMFIHIGMSKEEHAGVVGRLCETLGELGPAEVPPLVHQLLLLTRHHNTMILFFSLRNYYHHNIYKEDSFNLADSTQLESPDIIESAAQKEIMENQSVVLYHIEDCAKRSLGCTTELLKVAKSAVCSPELFIEPFLLSVLLSLSTLPLYETQVMDILKATIVRSIMEEEKRVESDWLRKLLTTSCDVESVLVKLIRSSVCDQECVIRGLVELSMVLMRQSAGSKQTCHKVWMLGRMIAVNVMRKHHQVARTLLSYITDSIINMPDVAQYTDCLAEVCDTSPLLVVENTGCVSRLLDALPDLPPCSSHKIISAVISLTRVSSKLRDNLILVLRKSLFTHDESTRKMAVFGFLQLLKRLKLKGLSSMSQNSFQIYTCPSVLTQTCLDIHATNTSSVVSSASNEGICVEVVNILKRCFMQQASVKITLYQGINKALIHNPELCISVAGVFTTQILSYFESEESTLPPLDFSKAVIMRNNEPLVLEPLGHLLFALNQILVTGKSLPLYDDDEFFSNQEKLQTVFTSLINRFGLCETKHFELDGDERDSLKEEVLKELLMVYQSLMVHLVSSWDLASDKDHATSFLTLFRTYNHFTDFAKKLKDEGGGGRRGRPAANREATAATQTQNSRKAAGVFTLPLSMFDFEAAHKLLSLILCESVDWCQEEAGQVLKSKKPVSKFAVEVCLDVISKAKTTLLDYRAKSVLVNSSDMAKLLFERCLKRFEEVMEYDAATAVCAAECFSEICSIIVTNFRKKLPDFLKTVCGEDEGLNTLLERVIKVCLKQLSKVMNVEEDNPDDPHYKKLATVLISTAHLLSVELPVNDTCIAKVLRWLMETCQQKSLLSLPNVKSLVSLLLALVIRDRSDSPFHDNLALWLCSLFGTVNNAEVERSSVSLNMVTDSNKAGILPLLCSSLSTRLDIIDWVIIRLRAEVVFVSCPQALPASSPTHRKCVLKKKERDVVQEMGLVVSACHWVCHAAVPAPLAENTCRLIHKVYTTLTQLTKYFTLRSSAHNPAYQEARFAKLVRLSASHLSTQLGEFILHIESIDDIENEKKLSKKVLNQAKKQTVYIPKLVAELENFTKCVTQLGNKCKDPNLSNNMKLTTTRDFRLNTKKLEEALKRNRESEDEDEADTTVSSNKSAASQASQKNKPTSSQKSKTTSSQKSKPTSSQKSQASSSQPPKKKKKLFKNK